MKKIIRAIVVITVFLLLNCASSLLFSKPVLNNSLTNFVSSKNIKTNVKNGTNITSNSIDNTLVDQNVDCLATDSVSVLLEEAKKIYNQTKYFNHVDIRVHGSLTTNEQKNDIIISNVKLTVVDGKNTIVNTSFNDNKENYEWRVTNVRIPKSAKVNLNFDIKQDGEIIREDYSVTYEGEEAFIQAIVDCDMHWGLDFIIDATEIINAVLPNVSYQWTGLPEELATPPEMSLGYNEGETHTINTTWGIGSYIVDDNNGKLYTFTGWKEWSSATDNHTNMNKLNGNAITVNADTIVYGEWLEENLEFAKSHIDITMSFVNNDNKTPENIYFTITSPNGAKEEIKYSDFVNSKYSLDLTTEGTYRIEQHIGSISGYESLAPKITTGLATTTINSNTITINVELAYKLPTSPETSTLIGNVQFKNEYKKKIGEPIHNYPDLEIEVAAEKDKVLLSGAVFTLTSSDPTKKPISSAPTDKLGTTKFKSIEAGEYILKEITAPKDYYISSTNYNISVKLNGVPTEHYSSLEDNYILIYDYKIEISPNTDYDIYNNKLRISNQEITGSINLSVEFSSNSDIKEDNFPALSKINVLITGGNDYEKLITLDSTNNWKTQITNLKLGTYKIKEIINDSNIPGYSLAVDYDKNNPQKDSLEVNFSKDTTKANILLTNTYTQNIEVVDMKAKFSIKSIDNTGKNISGATFELYGATGELVDLKVTDEEGVATFTGFESEGEYLLTLTKVPKGYNITNREWVINVNLKNNEPRLEYDEESNNFKKIYEWDLTIDSNDFDDGTLTVINEKIKDYQITDVPLTREAKNINFYVLITLFGIVGLLVTILRNKKSSLNKAK